MASHLKATSSLGSSTEVTGHNAFVRINSNCLMCGKSILRDASSHIINIPGVVYDRLWVSPETLVINGIAHQADPPKLVIKMPAGLSVDVSSGWSKTVIVSTIIEDDWGDANDTGRYTKVVGFPPLPSARRSSLKCTGWTRRNIPHCKHKPANIGICQKTA